MKKTLSALTAALLLTACASQQNPTTETNCIARRGCCSHHGGVAGCAGGRQKCRDGSLSPSCTCYRDDGDVEV